MKKFETVQFGVYSAKISTVRGKMTAKLFYRAGDEIPYEVCAKFRKGGKDYIYIRGRSLKNSWVLDPERNEDLFEEIRIDWENRCREFMAKLGAPKRIIADRGSLLVRFNGAQALIPDGIGDREFDIYTARLNIVELTDLYKFGFYEVVSIHEGETVVESNDSGTGKEIFRSSGVVSIRRDQNGNFAVIEVEGVL